MRVWIDQDLCTGVALCVRACPELFELGNDGLAYLRSNGQLLPAGQAGALDVPGDLLDEVLDAVEACPEACILLDGV